MSTCTWKGCESEGTEPQFDNDGVPWSCLCTAHATEIAEALFDGPTAMLRTWVLALGGAVLAAERMRTSAEIGQRVLRALVKPGMKVPEINAVFVGMLQRFEDGRP